MLSCLWISHVRFRSKVYPTRGDDPIPGLTCEMLTGENAALPPRLSKRERNTVDWFRGMAPVTCMTYTLDWHEIGRASCREGGKTSAGSDALEGKMR